MAGKKKESAEAPPKWEDVPEIPKEEQPYPLPEGWKWVYLYSIATIKRGASPRPIKSFITFEFDGVNWIKIGDGQQGKFIESTKDKITQDGAKKSVFVDKGTLLLSNSMSFGQPYILNISGCIHDGWLAIKPSSLLDKYFAYYAFLVSDWYFNKIAVGTTVRNLNSERVANLPVPFPPLEAQQRIVNRIESLFSKLDEAAAKVQAVIDSHEARKQAILHKAFSGELTQDVVIKEENNYKDMPEIPKEEQPYPLPEGWKWVYLEYGYDITSSKRIHKTDWRTDGIPFYRTRELVKLSEYGFVDNDLFIEEKLYNEIKNIYGVPKINDILISGVGTIGIPWVIENENKFYFKDGNVIWLKSKNTIISKYIFYLFKSGFIKNSLKRMASGTTVDTYTIVNAKKTKIPLPPLEIQQRIVACIESLFSKLDEAAAKVQAVIDNHEARKQAILHKAFNGELTQDVVIKEENNYKDIPEIPKEEQPYLLPK